MSKSTKAVNCSEIIRYNYPSIVEGCSYTEVEFSKNDNEGNHKYTMKVKFDLGAGPYSDSIFIEGGMNDINRLEYVIAEFKKWKAEH